MPGSELIGHEERKEIEKVFNSGGILYRQGFENQRDDCYQVRKFEEKFSSFLGVKTV